MKRNITFKTWISVFFGGIWQFFRSIFSWKNKTPFWRVIWAIITLCVLLFTCMIGYAFYRVFGRSVLGNNYYDDYYDSRLSADFKFHNNGYNEGKSFIYNSRTKKKVIKNIDWIAVPMDGDSLIVVAKDGKRGFVNRFTAEVAIPFQYDAAWLFSDGVAAVSKNDSVFYIDHNGMPINDKKFARVKDYDNYGYHGKFASIPVNGKFGLIDRNGDWKLQPEYSYISLGARNMWVAKQNNKYGVIGNDGNFVVPVIYECVAIFPEKGIILTNPDNSKSRIDYNGEILDEFVFDEIFEMAYYINEFDEEGNQKRAIDEKMVKYSSEFNYGLMTRDGKMITPPLYVEIQVVAPGVYQCKIPETYECILINSKGEKITN